LVHRINRVDVQYIRLHCMLYLQPLKFQLKFLRWPRPRQWYFESSSLLPECDKHTQEKQRCLTR